MIAPESLATPTLSIRKTATVRVDFKGRITMLNDEAELLFGLSRELLYSRPFTDFLAEEDRRGISQVVRQRHLQIESSLDLGPITFVAHTGETSRVRLLISIGYAAGNPANFHVTILPTQGIEVCIPSTSDLSDSIRIVSEDNSVGAISDNLSLLKLIASLTDKSYPEDFNTLSAFVLGTSCLERTALYRYEGESLICLGAFESDGRTRTMTVEEHLLPPITRLHESVCQSREAYRPDDEAAIRRAVELTGLAPHELALPIVIDQNLYCLRGWLPAEVTSAAIDELCDQLPRLYQIVRPVAAASTRSESSVAGGESHEWRMMTADHSHAVPALSFTPPIEWHLFDSNGNEVKATESHPETRYSLEQLCERIAPDGSYELWEKILEWQNLHRPGTTLSPLSFWPERNRLAFGWITDEGKMGLLFTPVATSSLPAWPESIANSLHRELAQLLKPLRATSARFLHQHLSALDKDGQFLAQRIEEQLTACDRLQRVAAILHQRTIEREEATQVDLRLLTMRTIVDVSSSCGCEQPHAEIETLPSVKTMLGKLESVLQAVLFVALNESRTVRRIEITSSQSDGKLLLCCRFPELKTDDRAIKQLMSLHRGFHEIVRTGREQLRHLSFARLLMQSCGGELRAERGAHSELIVTLTLPS